MFLSVNNIWLHPICSIWMTLKMTNEGKLLINALSDPQIILSTRLNLINWVSKVGLIEYVHKCFQWIGQFLLLVFQILDNINLLLLPSNKTHHLIDLSGLFPLQAFTNNTAYVLYIDFTDICLRTKFTKFSNFNSLKLVIKKIQLNVLFTRFQKVFLHIFVCNFWKYFSVISTTYTKHILNKIIVFSTNKCM